jgi:hypothetical protein
LDFNHDRNICYGGSTTRAEEIYYVGDLGGDFRRKKEPCFKAQHSHLKDMGVTQTEAGHKKTHFARQSIVSPHVGTRVLQIRVPASHGEV